MTEENPTTQPARSPVIGAWLTRLLVAALLLFGVEVLLWIDPPSRSALDWLLLAVGYLALATLTLDFAARYRIRDIYDAMLLAAVIGLSGAVFLNPETTFDDVPRTLVSRAIGGHSVMSLYMIGLFMALTARYNRRYRRRVVLFAVWLGFFWGVWVRWSPSESDWLSDDVTLETMYLAAAVTLGAALCLFGAGRRYSGGLTPGAFILPPVGLAVLTLVVLIALILRALDGTLDGTGLFVAALLAILSAMTLWYRRTEGGVIMLDAHIPGVALSPAWITLTAAAFVWAAALAYHLPLVELVGINQLELMEFLFVAAGFIWLPLVALVFSSRAIDRQWGRLDPL